MDRRGYLSALAAFGAGAASMWAYENRDLGSVSDIENVTRDIVAPDNSDGPWPGQKPPAEPHVTDQGVERIDSFFGFGHRKVERKILQSINNRLRTPLPYNAHLGKIARYQAAMMARDDYLGHHSPNGWSVQDRYQHFGYDCPAEPRSIRDDLERLELVGRTTAYEWREDDDAEQGVAREIVNEWYLSGRFQKAIYDWERVGIGVWGSLDEKQNVVVYVCLNLC